MAGLQSSNKIWEDWLRTSLNAMVNLRYYDLEIWMDKVKVTKATTKFEKFHLEQTFMQRFTYMLYTVKTMKWPWTGKVKVRVKQKCCSLKDLIKVYKHAKYNVCNH